MDRSRHVVAEEVVGFQNLKKKTKNCSWNYWSSCSMRKNCKPNYLRMTYYWNSMMTIWAHYYWSWMKAALCCWMTEAVWLSCSTTVVVMYLRKMMVE